MEKNAVPLSRYLAIVLTVYVTGFVVALLFYKADAMVAGISLAGSNPFTEAASWPMDMLQMAALAPAYLPAEGGRRLAFRRRASSDLHRTPYDTLAALVVLVEHRVDPLRRPIATTAFERQGLDLPAMAIEAGKIVRKEVGRAPAAMHSARTIIKCRAACPTMRMVLIMGREDGTEAGTHSSGWRKQSC